MVASLVQIEERLIEVSCADAIEIAVLRDELARAASASSPVEQRLALEAVGALSALLNGDPNEAEPKLAAARRFLNAALAAGAPRPGSAQPEGVSPPRTVAAAAVIFAFDDGDRELVGEFVAEAEDYVAQAEAAMLVLESNPSEMTAVDTVFRAFHTVKGVAAMLGLSPVSALAHKAESLLSKVRSRDLTFSGRVANLALASVDAIKALIQGLQAQLANEPWSPPENLEHLATALVQMTEGSCSPELSIGATPSIPAVPEPAPRADPSPIAEPPSTTAVEDLSLAADWGLVAVPSPPVAAIPVAAQHPVARPTVAPFGPTPPTATQPASVASAPAGQPPATAQGAVASSGAAENASVRIRTERLDRLVDMVGELVIAHSMVRQDPTLTRAEHIELTRKVAHAGKIVRELQELAMALRMVPLKPTFQKLARVVRDTAQKSGKAVELIVAGEDTEIDRNMVDIIADPLVHMLRNGVDHGIESPDERVSKGKPRSGTLRLTASHAGGNVIVELRDDGAGLDRARILRKAVERGLVEEGTQLSDSDVYNLIFEPGFSTRDAVTDVSGRGVGMDVVRRNVQQLNGRVDITSTLGVGTTFTLRLPLTLAVTDGMLVRVGAERFIIPTMNIQTSLRPLAEQLSTVSNRGELLFIRGELIPLFRLHRLFDLLGAVEDPTRALAVVVNGVEGRCALLVDELLGQHQVVAKSLGHGIGNVRGIAGGAILGDGRVGLILDAPEVIALAREVDAVASARTPRTSEGVSVHIDHAQHHDGARNGRRRELELRPS